MVDYFRQKYDVSVDPPNQPLLFVNQRDSRIYLPTSLCHDASLPKNFTKDAFKMRTLATYKVSNPNDRFDRISNMINRFEDNAILNEFNMKIQTRMAVVKG